MNANSSRAADLTGLKSANRQAENFLPGSCGLSLLFCFASVLMPAISSSALPVEVTQAEFTTHASISVSIPPLPQALLTNDSRTVVSSSPVQDLMEGTQYGYVLPYYIWARPTADWFHVSVDTSECNRCGSAGAYAISETTFSPLADAIADVTIRRLGGGIYDAYSEGFVSLVDLTLNRPLWYYQWTGIGNTMGGAGRPEPSWGYDITGNINPYPNPAIVVQGTAFAEDHAYRLVIYAASGAYGDDERVFMDLLGLEIVPEPSTFALLGLGTASLAIARRRR